jgi:AraC-like DNA-binding protein
LGDREEIQKAFKGATSVIHNFSAPIQDLVDRGIVKEKSWESSTMDLHFYPVWDGKTLAFVVCAFIVKTIYKGKPEVAKAQEYISRHWQEEFNANEIAKAVNLSERQLYKLFKLHTGMTPGYYHKKCKIEQIRKKLMDKNLNITEAFAACGEDSQGRMAKVFKEVTGLTPSQFRNSIS